MANSVFIRSYGEISLINLVDRQLHMYSAGYYEFERIPSPFGDPITFLRLKGTKYGAAESYLRGWEYDPAIHVPEEKTRWHDVVLMFSTKVDPAVTRELRLEDEEMVSEVIESKADQSIYYRMGYNYTTPRVMCKDAQGHFSACHEPWAQILERCNAYRIATS